MAKETKPKTRHKAPRADQMALPPVPAFTIGHMYRHKSSLDWMVIRSMENGRVTFEESHVEPGGRVSVQIFTMAGDAFTQYAREVYNV